MARHSSRTFFQQLRRQTFLQNLAFFAGAGVLGCVAVAGGACLVALAIMDALTQAADRRAAQ